MRARWEYAIETLVKDTENGVYQKKVFGTPFGQ